MTGLSDVRISIEEGQGESRMATRLTAWVTSRWWYLHLRLRILREGSLGGGLDQFWMLSLRNLVGHLVEMTPRQVDI